MARGESCPNQIPQKHSPSQRLAAVRQRLRDSMGPATGNAGCSRRRKCESKLNLQIFYDHPSPHFFINICPFGGLGAFDEHRRQDIAPRGLATALVAPASAAAAPDASGFIQRWLLLEPIPCRGVVSQNVAQAIIKKEYFPNQLTVVPKDGEKVSVGDAE